MSQFKLDKDELLKLTNGGLDILIRLYPQGDKKGSKYPHFKTHDEDTASTIFFKTKDGIWGIKNFGTGDFVNAIDALIAKENLDFYEALQWVAREFNIEGGARFSAARIEVKPATKGQKDGEYFFDYRDLLTEYELEVLGPNVNNKTALQYDLKSCKKFIQVKQYKDHKKYGNKLMQIITKGTDTYPIFVFDMGDWQKIYQPLNQDKRYRFRYVGEKLPHYLFGLDLIMDEYEPLKEGINEHNKDEYEKEYGRKGAEDPRAEAIIIASGDRDALNVASMGYPVVWKNSESEPLSYLHYKMLKERCKKLCYLGDLDITGIRETVSIALFYTDLCIIRLPEWITQETYRGKPCKDVTDWAKLEYRKKKKPESLKTAFELLVKDALPARFWNLKYNASGDFQGYEFDNEACLRFLQYNGFYRYEEDFSKEDFSFVHIEKNIVKRVLPHHVYNFPIEYLKLKYKPVKLLNYIHRSAQLSDKKLSRLEMAQPDFSNLHGVDWQYLFFKNKIIRVETDGIKEFKYGQADNINLWDSQIIDKEVRIDTDAIFTIDKKDTSDFTQWDITINKQDNEFLNFMINTSRIHWRETLDKPYKSRIAKIKEADTDKKQQLTHAIIKEREAYREANKFNIAETALPDHLQQEQKQNLINKIFTFGYALHGYKLGSKAWSGFAMDNRISDVNESNGGSGKSIVWHKALVEILPIYKYINGGDPESGKDKHLFDGVDRNTQAVIIDDLDRNYPFRKVYNNITGEFTVNPKHSKPYSLRYHESPKCFFTSNFGIMASDSSTMRRLLFTVFSDYYHFKSDDDNYSWSYRDETGNDLFSDFDNDQWDRFYSFCIQALQFYMSTKEKVDPPMENVAKRNALERFGNAFKDWADNFFETRKNRFIAKKYAMKHLEIDGGFRGMTSNTFKKKLNEWAKFNGYVMNPDVDGVLNTQGYCKHTIKGKTQECIVIHVPGRPLDLRTEGVQLEVKLDREETAQITEGDGDEPF